MNSWIWVIDWNSETAKPITSEVTRIGARELQRDDHASGGRCSMTVVSVMAAAYR